MMHFGTGGLSLVISGLVVRFPGMTVPALTIDALTLSAGSSLAVTGVSGSGKSTFVNAITGLDTIRHGSIIWQTTEINELPALKRDAFRAKNIGLVMQDFHLFPGMNALDNVLLPAKLSRRLRQEERQRALELLNDVGIKRPEQHIETLSRGEMQRVAIARALLAKPGVIVADEPTASLDRETGSDIAQLLVRIAAEQCATLIVVTHDLELVMRMQRQIQLEGGRIVLDSQEQ